MAAGTALCAAHDQVTTLAKSVPVPPTRGRLLGSRFGINGARRRERQFPRCPAGSTSEKECTSQLEQDVSDVLSSLISNYAPFVIRIETVDEWYDCLGARTEVPFVDDALLIDDEGLDPGFGIGDRPGDQRDPAIHSPSAPRHRRARSRSLPVRSRQRGG